MNDEHIRTILTVKHGDLNVAWGKWVDSANRDLFSDEESAFLEEYSKELFPNLEMTGPKTEKEKVWDKLNYVEPEYKGLDSITMPMIRKIMPTTIATDITGVQPMYQPIGDHTAGIEPVISVTYKPSKGRPK